MDGGIGSKKRWRISASGYYEKASTQSSTVDVRARPKAGTLPCKAEAQRLGRNRRTNRQTRDNIGRKRAPAVVGRIHPEAEVQRLGRDRQTNIQTHGGHIDRKQALCRGREDKP